MEAILDKFNRYNLSREDQKIIDELADIAMTLMPNKPLPDLELVSFDNRTLRFSQVINRPTMIYFGP